MAGVWAVIRSRLGRRFATACVLAALVPLIAVAAIFLREALIRQQADREAMQQGRAESLARSIEARLSASDDLAYLLCRQADSLNEAQLREAVAQTGIFDRLVLDESGAKDDASVGSLLDAHRPSKVFVARPLKIAGRAYKAYFFVSNEWLWRGVTAQTPIAVLDSGGKLLHNSIATYSEMVNTIAAQASASDAASNAVSRRVAWNADGHAWAAVVVPISLLSEHGLGVRWQVVAYDRADGIAVIDSLPFRALAALAILAAALAAALALAVASRYVLPLWELQAGLLRLGQQRYVPLKAIDHDEVSTVVDAFNEAGRRVDARIKALEILGDIDHLLLGATDLEPALDAILSRVLTVTRCQAVGIALLDRDSPHLGRIIAATEDVAALPVSRVEFDVDMYQRLLRSNEALTVARCEEIRHSFLAPLRQYGANYFWVWPVHANNRLVAVLAVGFREAPAPDPSLAENGSQFAARLAFAVSKTQRDEHLYRQAHYDALTTLPNRLLFHDRLVQELANAAASQSRGALLYIDLDHFKKVNDSVGHAAGDQLLTIVAQRLRATVKEGDTVARLAGDEFTVILRQVADPEGAAVVAERIIDALKMPVNISGRDHFVAASIGVTLFPDDGNSLEELMQNADRAMYRAKEAGRSRAVFFDRELMNTKQTATQSGLYRALRRREFALFYQPQFSIADGRLVGLEALLRWHTPREGTRHPNDFIPAAEATGLIVDIGTWVLEAACAQMANWLEQGIAPSRVSVNVSAQQLKFAEFPRIVKRTLDRFGIRPELLEIEVTESVFVDEAAGEALTQLAAIGVRLALDDFGTGYSSLNYLRQYPIQLVKIDRSFIEEISVHPASGALAATIVTMAHALGKEVVAEGVETEAQMNFLRDRRCDLAQGFFLAHPMPAENVTELLKLRSNRLQPDEETLRQTG